MHDQKLQQLELLGDVVASRGAESKGFEPKEGKGFCSITWQA
jgi:hypothetical protein